MLTYPEDLRIDWLPIQQFEGNGRVGVTSCPGRADRGRRIEEDLLTMVGDGVNHLVALLTTLEMEGVGVRDLKERAQEVGISYTHLSIQDYSIPTIDEVIELIGKIKLTQQRGETTVLHCMGGLGRSGLIAACLLVDAGLGAEVAIEEVRTARGPGAIETPEQEEFVATFAIHHKRDTNALLL